MGTVCNKPKSKTHVIIIESRPQQAQQTPKPLSEAHKFVGEKFQLEVETCYPQLKKKQSQWQQCFDDIEITVVNNEPDEETATPKRSVNTNILNSLNKQKLSNLLKEGALSRYRWNAWMAQVYNREDYDPKLYRKLTQTQPPDRIADDIRKDIARTFPNHDHFKEKGQAELMQVLTALSLQHPEIGYVQGMNQVVAFTLIVNNGDEEAAFWFINFLCLNPRFLWWNIYKSGFGYAKWICDLFQRNLALQLPALHQHFHTMGVINEQYVWQWLLTQFLYTFPMEAVLLFWDYMMASDICSFITISIAILTDLGSQLINFDLGEISDFFRNFIQEKRDLDVINILQTASKIELVFEEKDDEYLNVMRK